ncbi:MAG: hypothetical protein IH963_00770 [Chloroflexi bacterium]|nr:hypothetical protein [Chloroflexota bacterium]
MATQKAPTKAEFLQALSKNGIKNLEDLVDAIMPETNETGGYIFQTYVSEENEDAKHYLKGLGSINGNSTHGKFDFGFYINRNLEDG